MKKSLVALSVLSGVFLASNAVADVRWAGLSSQADASFTVSQPSEVKLSSTSSNSFDGYVGSGEQLFTLTVNAPQGVQVAVAGVNDVMGSDGSIMDNSNSRPAGASAITARPADMSLFHVGSDYIPTGGKPTSGTGGAVVIDGSNSDVDIEFIAVRDVPLAVAGKYTYTFIAQAFTE